MQKEIPFTECIHSRSQNVSHKRGRTLAWEIYKRNQIEEGYKPQRTQKRDWMGEGHKHSLGKARKEIG